ncbi:hypothetical protein [Undibacterium sp.]|uniref:hypothetical protein n=1 Tax=Undibacterium sp. TaxID=1914977 RepID=UPI00374D8ABB
MLGILGHGQEGSSGNACWQTALEHYRADCCEDPFRLTVQCAKIDQIYFRRAGIFHHSPMTARRCIAMDKAAYNLALNGWLAFYRVAVFGSRGCLSDGLVGDVGFPDLFSFLLAPVLRNMFVSYAAGHGLAPLK